MDEITITLKGKAAADLLGYANHLDTTVEQLVRAILRAVLERDNIEQVLGIERLQLDG